MQDGIVNSIIQVAANASLLLGSFWIARDAFRQRRGLPSALGTAVIFWAFCTLGLETLGELGMISPGSMLALGATIAGAGGFFRWLRPALPIDAVREPTPTGHGFWAVLSVSLVLAVSIHLVMRSLFLAVKVVSDGPIYHLYFAARWWKAGRLLLVAAPFGENAATYFPANGDLWFTWLMASWGGDRLARVGQAPFLAVAALAAFGCARFMGAGRSASAIATCWFVSSTPLLVFSFEPNVDTIFVAGYLLATYFFLHGLRNEGNTGATCLGALAAGAALGTKSVGLVFVPPLLLLAVAFALRGKAPSRLKIMRAAAIVSLPLVIGGYWFLRNLAVTGNPVYPLEVGVLSHTFWSGWYGPEAMHHSVYYIPFAEWRALGDTLLAALDPRLAPVWIAALCTVWVLKRAETDENRRGALLLSSLGLLNILLYWVCIPYRTQQRFMLQALGLFVVPLARLLDRATWLRVLATGLLALHLMTPQTWPFATGGNAIPWDLSPLIPNAVAAPLPLLSRLGMALAVQESQRSIAGLAFLLAIVLAAFLSTWSWHSFWRRRNRPRRFLITAIGASGLFILTAWLELWLGGMDRRFAFYPPFRDFYAGWVNLDARSGATGCRVAYAGTNLPYYLLGDHLRNEVRYVNIDEHRDWLMHDYHREACLRGEGRWPNPRPGWDRQHPDYESWIKNLEAEGIQLLVVTRVNPNEGRHNVEDAEGFPIERRWADSHPERFEPLYGQIEHDPWFRLYRIRTTRTDLGAGRHIYSEGKTPRVLEGFDASSPRTRTDDFDPRQSSCA
jgi:hypothetical protein